MVTSEEIKSRNKEFNYLINEIKRYYEPCEMWSSTNKVKISAYFTWVCPFKDLKGQYAIELHENCKLSVYCVEHMTCPEYTELEILNPIGQSLTSLFFIITGIITKTELQITEKRNKIIAAKRRATIAKKG